MSDEPLTDEEIGLLQAVVSSGDMASDANARERCRTVLRLITTIDRERQRAEKAEVEIKRLEQWGSDLQRATQSAEIKAGQACGAAEDRNKRIDNLHTLARQNAHDRDQWKVRAERAEEMCKVLATDEWKRFVEKTSKSVEALASDNTLELHLARAVIKAAREPCMYECPSPARFALAAYDEGMKR